MTTKTTAQPTERANTPSAGSRIFTAPSWVKSFYSKFPLVVLEQEDELDWKVRAGELPDQAVDLWIHPPSTRPRPHSRAWTSSTPTSLRTQLLLLLRETSKPVPVSFRTWTNEKSAPGGTLPALHIPGQERVLSTDEIRGWLEATYPLKGKGKELQGLPSQEAYDRALALSQLILGHLSPAYLASLPPATRGRTFHLSFPVPPPLSAGLTTPLPASLTGDSRDIDVDEVVKKGVEALDAVEVLLQSEGADEGKWALGAKHPTSLDALIASHLYVMYGLEESSLLRSTIESKPSLGDYVDRVLDYAEGRLNRL